jgi:hypothetical protein
MSNETSDAGCKGQIDTSGVACAATASYGNADASPDPRSVASSCHADGGLTSSQYAHHRPIFFCNLIDFHGSLCYDSND